MNPSGKWQAAKNTVEQITCHLKDALSFLTIKMGRAWHSRVSTGGAIKTITRNRPAIGQSGNSRSGSPMSKLNMRAMVRLAMVPSTAILQQKSQGCLCL